MARRHHLKRLGGKRVVAFTVNHFFDVKFLLAEVNHVLHLKNRRKLVLEHDGVSTAEQTYDPTPIINELRGYVDTWRALPNPQQWQVTPETARRQWLAGALRSAGLDPLAAAAR